MVYDWKAISQSPGYKSLKAAYMQDIQKKRRNKQECRHLFRRVIGLAKNHSVRTGKSVEDILTAWEAERDYWWVNFYSAFRRQKLPSGKPSNVHNMSVATYLKTLPPEARRKTRERDKAYEVKRRREAAGKPARWTAGRKALAAKYRNL